MRVIRGGPGSGKTELVYREFAEAVRAGAPKLRLVVPTATLVRHSQHELARQGLVFSPNSVLSLSRFAQERALTAEGKGLVPDGLLRAFVRDALRRIQVPDFGRVSGTEGMAGVIVDTIHLLENGGGTPASLGAVRGLQPIAKAFLRVWQAVDEAVRRSGFATRGGLFRAAANQTADRQAQNPEARVWMDGFLHLSPLESNLVRALAPVCDLTITLGVTEASEEMYRLCLALGARTVGLASRTRAQKTVMIDAASAEREAAEIARRVIGLHGDGVALREIAVAVRDAETYVPLLRAAFERFGVPARFYFPRALQHHPAAVFLNGLIDGGLADWDFETTLRALRSHPGFGTGGRGTSAAFDRFDFAVREAMPGHGASGLLSLAGAGWLHGRVAECLGIGVWQSARMLPAEWAARFGKMAASLYRPGQIEPGSTNTEEARSHSAALGAWIGAVESAAAFWPAEQGPLSLEEFWAVAKEAVETAEFRIADERANVVHAIGVHEARQWNVHTLIVCGVTDRDFPRRQAENLIFRDREIERLNRAGIAVRRAGAEAADSEKEERWLFDALRTRATGNLIITVPRHDTAGHSAERSRYLAEFEAAPERAPLCVPSLTEGAESTGLAGRIESPRLLALVAGLHRTVTPTALEKLVQCPFQFFADRTLALKPAPDRPQERLQARVTGTILHEALEKWQTRRERDFVEVFDETWEDTCRRKHLPPGYRLEVERFIYRNIALQVGATEKWRRPDRTLVEEAFELPFPGGITVKGRIDRIDVYSNAASGDECVVIDYKSSKTANVRKLVESETKLQGPIYALAARDQLGLKPVAMAFWAVREDELFGWGEIPDYKGKALQEMPRNWADDARTFASERLATYLAGDAVARPHDEAQCKWCDFAAACRVETLTRGMTAGAGEGTGAGSGANDV